MAIVSQASEWSIVKERKLLTTNHQLIIDGYCWSSIRVEYSERKETAYHQSPADH